MGLFDDIVKINGEVKSVESNLNAAANDPVVLAVKEGIKLLPEGDLKKWVSANPKQFWTLVKEAFTGRTYTKNEYRIGERYLDNVVESTPVDSITNTGQVPDDIVPIAKAFMTIAFGVRITTTDDLDALQRGVDAYYTRPEKSDIPRKAVERAVMLKQSFFPDSTYNSQKWDLSKFEKYPLVAPIPGLAFNTLYTGDIPGVGKKLAKATNGVIEGDAALKQVIEQLDLNPDGTPKTKTSGIGQLLTWGLLLGLGYALFKKKPKNGR